MRSHFRLVASILTVLIVTVLVQFGCKEGPAGPAGPSGSDSYGDLTDPTVPLKVQYTIPQDKGVGPFPIFNRAYTYKPHFTIQFNKLMDRSTITSKSVKCQGGSWPTLVAPFSGSYSYPTTTVPGNIMQFYLYYSGPGSYPSGPFYEVGKTYTVTVDTTVADLYGNHLSTSFTFSFTPEPNFRVIASVPADGDSNMTVGRYSNIVLYLNSPLRTSDLSLVTLTPSVQGQWGFSSSDAGTIYLTLSRNLAYNTVYTLSLGGTAEDTQGHQLGSDYNARFTTAAFTATSMSPADGSTFVSTTTYIYANFTGDLDGSTVANSFSIAPQTAGSFSTSGSQVQFAPVNPLKSGTTYTATFSQALKAVDGTPLATPVTTTFTTQPFRVSSVYPNDGSTNVGPSSYIEMYFTAAIDPLTFASAFNISPAVPGQFGFSNYTSSSYATFHPSQPWTSSTTYTVTLSADLKAFDGSTLGQPYTFSFTTQPFHVDGVQPSYGATVSRTSPVTFYLSEQMDTASAKLAWSMSPTVNGWFSYDYYGTSFTFYPSSQYAAGTVYTITLSTDLKSQTGGHLLSPYQTAFVTDYFKLTSAYPSSGSQYVSRYTQISLTFSDSVNMASVSGSITITPPVAGTFSSYGSYPGMIVTFSPNTNFSANTQYAVTVKTSLRSTGGDTLRTPYSFWFATGQ